MANHTTKQFCVNGHDTHIVGRKARNYECCECKRIRDAKYNAERAVNAHRDPRVPYAPLVPYLPVPGPTGFGWQAMGGVNAMPEDVQKAIYRAKRAGSMTVYAADRVATWLGRHPAEIWAEWLWVEA
jgi:hypothetical protein